MQTSFFVLTSNTLGLIKKPKYKVTVPGDHIQKNVVDKQVMWITKNQKWHQIQKSQQRERDDFVLNV